jgi:hypothetical protein
MWGCTSVTPKVATPDKMARVEINKSTKQDVLTALGLPHKREVKTAESGEQLEYWVYLRGAGTSQTTYFLPVGAFPVAETGAWTLSVIPLLGLPLSEKEKEQVAGVVVFNKDGVVVNAFAGGDAK